MTKKRGFCYNSKKTTAVTIWSHVLGFLRLNDPPSLVGGGLLFIQVSICWIRLHSSHPFEDISYLTCLSWRQLEPNILIWIGRARICPYHIQLPMWSLSSCNRRIQMKIWVGDRGTCNHLYLYPLEAWTARSLDEIMTLLRRFSGNDHVSRDRPGVGWTRVVISRRSKTDHYSFKHLQSCKAKLYLSKCHNCIACCKWCCASKPLTTNITNQRESFYAEMLTINFTSHHNIVKV